MCCPSWLFSVGVKTLAALSLAVVANAQIAQRIDFIPTVAATDIDEFALSPDGTQIAFVGALEGIALNGSGVPQDRAFVAPIGGGAAVQVTPSDSGETDGNIIWTPDGLSVLVRYDKDLGNANNNIYRLPADGSQVETQLTFSPTNVFDIQVTPDGSTLIFSDNRQDDDANFDDLTYTAPIAVPGAATLITPDPITEIDTGSYAQVGSDLVFASTAGTDGNNSAEDRFYRVAIDGSGVPVEIPVIGVPADGDIDAMQVTPDGQTIVFIADLTDDNVNELYSLPIAGGTPTKLLPTVDAVTDINSLVISPDGQTIAFVGDYLTNGIGEAFVIPIDGGEPTRISNPSPRSDFDVVGRPGAMAFSADGQNIYYLSDFRSNGLTELFVAPVVPIPEPTALVLGALAVLPLLHRRKV